MEVIQITANKTAVWLDHAQLINLSYKDSNSNDTNGCYELRKELFYFNAVLKNEMPTLRDEGPYVETNVKEGYIKDLKPDKNKKRKKQPELLLEAKTSDVQDFEINMSIFLQQLKQKGLFESNNGLLSTSTILRFWEEKHEFPKFNGANATNEFKRFSFGGKTYLIPAHCRFFNQNVTQMKEILTEMQPYDLILMDPPWRNKYIRRLKRLKIELAYDMLNNTELQQLPIHQLIHRGTLVAIWCTNSQQHQRALVDDILPAWNLSLVHAVKWLKVNTSGQPICGLSDRRKKPYEMLFISCHKENQCDFSSLKAVEFLASIPSIVHSHKPPLFKWLKEYLPTKANCLELFARYLHPQFTSIGLEVLKLMDERMYDKV